MSLKNRIIAICPLLSVMIFLLLVFAKDLGASQSYAHPGWVIFLLTPVVTGLLNMKRIRFMIAISVVALYLVLGVGFNLWHPGWVIFLLIPILNILINPRGNFTFRKRNDNDDE